ncbi:RuBisCO large subunit C-terminal-like domain-containing protein [Acidiferrobacter thiooxydans]|uniref:RuBisCO large subunit C-terminal-like domain-containing protein n=1 Tax=Acidiferrobacter thiooxydans TaxID=163359 RepID=UPI000B2BEBD4|nr:RuBisCO large subunit C-terminal-like domain-containing protein [Acidiferrobacter thiooxydans]UEN99885.1 hypothetical protein A9R16_000375 [Acidiferrobacter thiooxydans]
MIPGASSTPLVIATYRFPSGVDAGRQAEIIAIGQTLGSADARFAGREQALAACRGQVLEVRADGDGARAQVAFPAANTEYDIGTLLTMVFGKYSLAGPARLVDLRLPPDFGTRPRFGIAGLRARLGVAGRPLLMAIFKPALGLTAADHATLLRAVADTELDLVKDDEILGNLAQAPTRERLRACRPVIEAIRDRRGRDFLYAVNVTGRADTLLATARALVAEGANALLLNVLVYGYPMLEALARDPAIGVPIIAHPALAGALALAPDHGIDYALVLGRLMRHAGADVVLHPARFGSLPFSAADESRVITALTDSDDHWPAVFPGPSAGIKPAIVPALLADYGRDLVINAGSAIFDAATGPKAAVESFFAAMDA